MVAELVRGIGAQGRSKTYHRRGLWAIKKKHGGKFPHHEKKEKAAEPAQKVCCSSAAGQSSTSLHDLLAACCSTVRGHMAMHFTTWRCVTGCW